MEHEASTSKIGEDQLFYFQQRGIEAEEAVGIIIGGFCREVFDELPQEFASEVSGLMSLKLEGLSGMRLEWLQMFLACTLMTLARRFMTSAATLTSAGLES